jgi:hypothetical protein
MNTYVALDKTAFYQLSNISNHVMEVKDVQIGSS